MNLDSDVFILVVALLIVAGICLGLLIALAIFFLGRRNNSRPRITNDYPPPINQNKKTADYYDSWENETLRRYK